MAEKYSFFNAQVDDSGNYDRTYLAEDYAAYFASFIGDGVYADNTNNLKVVSASNMTVTLKAGKAWCKGYFYINDADMTHTLDNADGAHSRIDRIVIKLDLINRQFKSAVKKGVASVNPAAPTLTRTSDVWEMALADILVGAGVSSIVEANITDKRFDNVLCGVVSGVVDQIDTTNLFAQYNDEFNTWFTTIQGILGQDEAANLLNFITAHTADKANPHEVTAVQVGAAPTNHTHTKDQITDFPTTMTPSAHTHTKNQITDFPTTMTPSAHNQAASTITAGTLAGQVKANASAAATVTTAQVRDIYAGTGDMVAGSTALATGTIYFMYE
ncbi:MAG: hypothetical protein VB064_03105 [Oscillospiraceae bacterium]|nr:hypothetical protein [Oscillospiraceae bacterium]